MPTYDFDGGTFDRERDGERLSRQYSACFSLMSDHKWWTLSKLSDEVSIRIGKHASEASVSARIRDMRKEKFGGHVVDRQNVGGGLWVYRLVPQEEVALRKLAPLNPTLVS